MDMIGSFLTSVLIMLSAAVLVMVGLAQIFWMDLAATGMITLILGLIAFGILLQPVVRRTK